MLHIKLSVYYTVSFMCNTYFLNSTFFIFNQFKNNKFLVLAQLFVKTRAEIIIKTNVCFTISALSSYLLPPPLSPSKRMVLSDR